jgi:hypothetical protein
MHKQALAQTNRKIGSLQVVLRGNTWEFAPREMRREQPVRGPIAWDRRDKGQGTSVTCRLKLWSKSLAHRSNSDCKTEAIVAVKKQ